MYCIPLRAAMHELREEIADMLTTSAPRALATQQADLRRLYEDDRRMSL